MTKYLIKVKSEKQIELITPILVLNGYTVRKTSAAKPNAKTKQTVLEYWEEEK